MRNLSLFLFLFLFPSHCLLYQEKSKEIAPLFNAVVDQAILCPIWGSAGA